MVLTGRSAGRNGLPINVMKTTTWGKVGDPRHQKLRAKSIQDKNDVKPTAIRLTEDYFNTVYVPYLYKTNKYNVFWGGRASGKTVFIIQKNIIYLYQHPGKNMTVIMKEYNGIKEKVFDEIVAEMNKMGMIEGIHYKLKLTPYKIYLTRPGQPPSIISFKGGDDGEKMKGVTQQDIVWFEEANNIKPSVFRGIIGSMRGSGRDNTFYISFNPESESSWLKKYFFDVKGEVTRQKFDNDFEPMFDENGEEIMETVTITRGGINVDDITTVHTTYNDNDWGGDKLAKYEYVQAVIEPMKEQDPMVYEVWSKGIWGTLGRRVYTNWKVEEFDYLTLLKEKPHLVRTYGLDHGYEPEPNAIVCSLVDKKEKKIYVYKDYYGFKQTPDVLAQEIKRMGLQRARFHADSSEKKTNELLRKYGIYNVIDADKGKDSIMPGIKYIKQYQIIVHPDCTLFRKEIEQYHFIMNERDDTPTEKPVDKDNHCMDAFRYSMQEVENLSEMKVLTARDGRKKYGFGLRR